MKVRSMLSGSLVELHEKAKAETAFTSQLLAHNEQLRQELAAVDARAATAEALASERLQRLDAERMARTQIEQAMLAERGLRERVEGELLVERDARARSEQRLNELQALLANQPQPQAPAPVKVDVKHGEMKPPTYEMSVSEKDGTGRITKMILRPMGEQQTPVRG